MDEKKKFIDKNKLIISIALLFIFLGLYLVSRNYLLTKKEIVYENVGFSIYDEKTLSNIDSLDEKDDSKDDLGEGDDNPSPKSDDKDKNKDKDNDKKKNVPNYTYIGTLEIPKINLKKGFVDPKSKYNDIKYNVTIIDGFDYPDVKYGNFILAAHSGTGALAYFRNLYKLQVGDKAIVTYKDKKYTYKIKKIYTQKKQGYLTIYRDVNKTTLTLITCTKNNKKLQTVYIAELS